jgi:phage repressor protein C with HTH and peptisase S24 domain
MYRNNFQAPEPVESYPLPVETLGKRIRHVRSLANLSQEAFAGEIGVKRGAVGNWEHGGGVTSDNLAAIAERWGVSLDWLQRNMGDPPALLQPGSANLATVPMNARMGGHVRLGATVPVYGHAAGGPDGQFVLNGNKVTDILAPPSLAGVPDAYAVYVSGTSMENRYFAGEAVFVNPRLPVRRGDFVVAQVQRQEGEPPEAYVKRFIAREASTLKLEQFNPAKILRFPNQRVVSVHRIIMGGDG